eukprot:CAMPEP_0172634368 /NCGR_PEP_ID=MMETSP1068-20121228/194224_1 /TAXON_ID=35684 /ORGANISM="Pseudopedinella elastica, Strain CCMP716" /LENGTH=147 /DNA_ID=CAMNT_0013446311 /DNA_START=48 /DNA_END=491 /DNA_ORIENTATION=-
MASSTDVIAEYESWEPANPQTEDGILRWEWDTEGLWLGIMIYNPQNGLGLLVTSVDPEGQAGKRGVKLGDRMVELNGKLIPNNMPDPVLAEMLFGLPRPIRLGFKPRKQKKATTESMAAAAAGFGEASKDDAIPLNTGTPLKSRRDE